MTKGGSRGDEAGVTMVGVTTIGVMTGARAACAALTTHEAEKEEEEEEGEESLGVAGATPSSVGFSVLTVVPSEGDTVVGRKQKNSDFFVFFLFCFVLFCFVLVLFVK